MQSIRAWLLPVGMVLTLGCNDSAKPLPPPKDEATRRAAQRERIRISLRRAGVGHIQLRTDRDWVQDIARFVLAYRRVASMLHAPPQGVTK